MRGKAREVVAGHGLEGALVHHARGATFSARINFAGEETARIVALFASIGPRVNRT